MLKPQQLEDKVHIYFGYLKACDLHIKKSQMTNPSVSASIEENHDSHDNCMQYIIVAQKLPCTFYTSHQKMYFILHCENFNVLIIVYPLPCLLKQQPFYLNSLNSSHLCQRVTLTCCKKCIDQNTWSKFATNTLYNRQ